MSGDYSEQSNAMLVGPRCLPNASAQWDYWGHIQNSTPQLLFLFLLWCLYGFGGVLGGGLFFVFFFTPEHTLSALSLPLHFLLYWDGEKQS